MRQTEIVGHTVEPRFNEVAGDPAKFVRYIEGFFFHLFYYYLGKEYRSLY